MGSGDGTQAAPSQSRRKAPERKGRISWQEAGGFSGSDRMAGKDRKGGDGT